MTAVKICGLRDADNLRVAAEAGARFAGFVFYPPSPRFVEPEAARILVEGLPEGVCGVGLFVNPSNEDVSRILGVVPLDMIQLHGEESPARVAEIAGLANVPVIKAIRLRGPEDADDAAAYEDVADWLLFDSKIDHDLPGGTGQRFDWEILKGRVFKRPWMLSGGLDPGNVAEALKVLRPDALDVSSGVEKARGVKDPEKIRAFIAAARHVLPDPGL